MYKCLLIIALLCLTVFAVHAQKPDTVKSTKRDILIRKTDSLESGRFKPKIGKEKIYHPDSTHSPHKAVMLSLYFPALGQAYNHKYWKMPLIYAGLGSLVWGVLFNAKYYNDLLRVAQLNERGTTLQSLSKEPDSRDYKLLQTYGSYSSASVLSTKDYYRRTRDICILGFAGGYAIQLIDAYIDAKFMHSYSMDNNLSFKVTPGIMGQSMPSIYAANLSESFAPSLTITITLR